MKTRVLSTLLFFLTAFYSTVGAEVCLVPNQGFSVEIPSGWTRNEEGSNSEVRLHSPTNDANIIIKSTAIEKTVDLKNYESLVFDAATRQKSVVGFSDYKELSRNDSFLGTVKARSQETIGTSGGIQFEGCSCIAVADGHGFSAAYTARAENYDKHIKEFQDLLKSFKTFAADGTATMYSSKRLGIAFEFPPTWQCFKTHLTPVAVRAPSAGIPGECVSNLVLATTDSPALLEPGAMARIAQDIFERSESKPAALNFEPPEAVQMGNVTGYRLSFTTTTAKGHIIKQQTYFTISGTRSYTLIVSMEASHFEDTKSFDLILKSLKITGPEK